MNLQWRRMPYRRVRHANWRDAAQSNDNNVDIRKLALGVQGVMIAADMQSLSAEDKSLREELLDWHGPLKWLSLASNEIGTRPKGDIEATAPSTLEFQLPVELAAGADFVTTGTLHPVKGKQGSVQMQALLSKPSGEVGLAIGGWKKQGDRKLWTDADTAIESDLPILINESGDAKRRIEKGIAAFRQVFPAALCYTKIVPVDEVVTLTLYYREDDQLRRLMLNDQQAQTLDELWDGLRFVSHEPLQLVDAFEQLWQFATQDADPSAFEPLRQPIIERAESFRKTLAAAEPRHVEAALDFAERAWRRPLTSAECDNLQALYLQLRDQGLQHDEAVRTLLARVLIAPAFLYKLEQSSAGAKPSSVSDLELATRLSYFLWSSTPDSELMSLAQSGKLSDPLVLIAQTRRMLRDAKMRRFAIHFGCQWLGVRDFDTHDEKSERHFPEFAGLRSAMYEEPIRFLTNLVNHDSSVLSILNADHTFVDPALADFYRFPKQASQDWVRVDGVHRFGRGGVLSMAATLARQSGASRTSPILRGNWVYETLLGQHLPRPPKDIPQLPDTVPEGLTERQLIEQHSSAPACAKCHVKIDPFGFALEGFDAIGRARSAVDTRTRLPNGKRIEGLEGLRGYLLEDRRDDFLRQFCRKLLGYGLGRAVQLSDDPLIDTMLQELATNEFRVGVAIEQVVLSPQFRMIRGQAREAEQ